MNNTVFCSSKWRDVLNSAYGFSIANDGFEIPVYEVRSILGKRKWVVVPFGDYAVHPEVTPCEDILNELGELALRKGIGSIEWRGGNISLPEWQRRENFVLHQLRLQGDVSAVDI